MKSQRVMHKVQKKQLITIPCIGIIAKQLLMVVNISLIMKMEVLLTKATAKTVVSFIKNYSRGYNNDKQK